MPRGHFDFRAWLEVLPAVPVGFLQGYDDALRLGVLGLIGGCFAHLCDLRQGKLERNFGAEFSSRYDSKSQVKNWSPAGRLLSCRMIPVIGKFVTFC